MNTIQPIARLAITLLFFLVNTIILIAQPLVVFPNGGQTLTVGSTVTITWSGTPLGAIVGIDYTIDNWVNTIWLNTNYSNPSANSYTWVVPNTPGTQCKVGIFDTNFQGDISDNFFTIAPASVAAPVANFTFAGAPCSTKTINFSDASSNSPSSWNWSVVPSASISNPASQNPGIVFAAPGSYSVTLVSSNSAGQSAPVTKTISVNASPTIQVTSSSSLICSGQAASLTAGGAATYVWSSGATSTSISVSPTVTTTYSVTGTNTANCSNTATHIQSVTACTSLQEMNSNSDHISVFPNPAKESVTIIRNNSLSGTTTFVRLYTLDGKLLLSDSFESDVMAISLQSIKPGFYFIYCASETQILKIKKLIVD